MVYFILDYKGVKRCRCESKLFSLNNIMGKRTRKKRGGGPKQAPSQRETQSNRGSRTESSGKSRTESRTASSSKSRTESRTESSGKSRTASRTESSGKSRTEPMGATPRNIEKNCEHAHAELKELAKHVNREIYDAVYRLFEGTKCDLFIYKKGIPNPHIHVFKFVADTIFMGIGTGTYHYAITAKQIPDAEVRLVNRSRDAYKSVLTEMYNALNDTSNPLATHQTPPPPEAGAEPKKPKKKPLPTPLQVYDPKEKELSIPLGPTKFKEVATPVATPVKTPIKIEESGSLI